MSNLNYQLCGTRFVGVGYVIREYSWNLFNCKKMEKRINGRTNLTDYTYFGSAIDSETKAIVFADEWNAIAADSFEAYRMSFQLITPKWENVGQLDLPMVHEGKPRRFSIDISAVPAGTYRLMAIMYNSQTGKRFTWIDDQDFAPEMLLLEELELPAN